MRMAQRSRCAGARRRGEIKVARGDEALSQTKEALFATDEPAPAPNKPWFAARRPSSGKIETRFSSSEACFGRGKSSEHALKKRAGHRERKKTMPDPRQPTTP